MAQTDRDKIIIIRNKIKMHTSKVIFNGTKLKKSGKYRRRLKKIASQKLSLFNEIVEINFNKDSSQQQNNVEKEPSFIDSSTSLGLNEISIQQ